MPIGLRGVRKTVLLNRFAEIARQEGFAVAQAETPETGEFVHMLAGRIRAVLMDLDTGPVLAAVTKARRVLKAFTLMLPDGSSIRIDVDAIAGLADSGLLSDDLTDLLVSTGEAANARGRGVLLAIDEVQYLTSRELAALIVAIHRTTQLDLPIVLVGAGLPQLPGLSGDAKSYAERLFEFPEIGSLREPDAKAAIAVPAKNEGLDFTDEALNRVVAASHGYPYFLQEWGYHVWNQASGSPVDAEIVEAVSLGAEHEGGALMDATPLVAAHEAGHAVAAYALGCPITKLEAWSSDGLMKHPAPKDRMDHIDYLADALIALAGRAYTDSIGLSRFGSDEQDQKNAARALVFGAPEDAPLANVQAALAVVEEASRALVSTERFTMLTIDLAGSSRRSIS